MPDLAPLLQATSVAVVGASPKRDSFGWFTLRQLLDSGFPGRICPVNPGYSEIDGYRCYGSLAEIHEPVDCVAICVADSRLEVALLEVASSGIKAAVIYGTAAGVTSTGQPLSARLAEIARDADIALMGASCMGFFNFTDRLFLTGYPFHRDPEPGSIAFITHSGSTLSAVAKNTRGMNFNYVISPGQEIVLTAVDYLDFVLDQPETRVVGLFLEAIRDPNRFLEALSKAQEVDVPVVLLKVGRSEKGATMALAHTGALAGAQATIEAVASRYNVVLVRTIEEMLDTLELLNTGRRPTTSALASVHDSGGERGMLVDLAADIGIVFADLAPDTMQTLEQTLDPGLSPGNPADLWGSGNNWQHVYRACIDAMINDSAVGAFNFGIDFNIGSRLGPDYKAIAIEAFNSTDKPFAVIANVASGIDPSEAAELRAGGIPVLLGPETGLLAFGHLFRYSARRSRPLVTLLPAVTTTENDFGGPVAEYLSLKFLRDAGLPTVDSILVMDRRKLRQAARKFGFPLVLKTADPNLLHKSDVGGVITGLKSMESLDDAYEGLAFRLGNLALVQPHVDLKSGVELFLGGTLDPQFGPLITVGFGGVLVEILDDTLTFLAPVTAAEVLDRLPDLRGFPLLIGARGKEPVDLPTLASLVADFSLVAYVLASKGMEVDANPVFARGSDFLILDALIVPVARVE